VFRYSENWGGIGHRLCVLRERKRAMMATNFRDRLCCSGDSGMKHWSERCRSLLFSCCSVNIMLAVLGQKFSKSVLFSC